MGEESMTKDQFIILLKSILKEREQSTTEYSELYDKCVLGYDLSHSKNTGGEDKLIFNNVEPLEGMRHLKSVLTTLINCYGKERVVNILKDM